MTKRKRKALLSAVICSALIGTGSFITYADGIQTQADADTLNASLETGDAAYSDSHHESITTPRSYVVTGQVFGRSGPITIGNSNTSGHTLTLEGDLRGKGGQDYGANILSDTVGMETTITHLQSLNLHLSGTYSTGSSISYASPGNVLVNNGGTITIDDSVKTLNAVMTRDVPHSGNDQNIYARNGTITVLSPTVNLETQGGHDSICVDADGRGYYPMKANINLGDDTHQLESITMKHTDRSDADDNDRTAVDAKNFVHFGIHAATKYDATEETIVRVNTKRLDIRHMTMGIRANGNMATSTAVVRVNTRENKADTIYVEANDVGISSVNRGRNEIYGKRIDIETGSPHPGTHGNETYGVESMAGGHATIGAGSDAGEGLFLQGPGSSVSFTYGLRAHDSTNDTKALPAMIDITSGNVDINQYKTAVLAGGPPLYEMTNVFNGTIRLGTAAERANNITIRNSSQGLYASTNGNIEVNSRNLDIYDDVNLPVGTADSGSIDIHTSGAATIHKASGTAISNVGHVSVNTGADDGATKITGTILTLSNSNAATDISFHTADSRFYGNAFDETGKSTITVSNGADWTINPTVTHTGLTGNTVIDTLHLSNNGNVHLGTEAETAATHTDMRVANLDGKGGTLYFRTNLEDSASTRTVDGHSDQLTISGTSDGIHNIMVYDHSRTIGQPVDDGYVLLVKDQGTRRNAVFRGAATLQNGGLFNRYADITNESPDAALGYTDVPTTGTNWYLRLIDNPVIPPTPTPNAENNMTFSRSRYGALWIEQETLRQRLGELRDHKQDDGIWARITRGEYTMNGVSGNADYTMYHIGYDKKIGNQKGHKQYIGAAYHHTDTDLNYRHFTDDSDMDADIGTIYYTNLGDKGHYLDIVGKFGRMKGKMKTFGEFPESAKWDSPFYSLSAEYGRKILYDNGWYWEPQAQLTYSHLGSDNYLTSQGTHAHVDNINSLIFRTGFTVGKKNGRNEYYGKVFWHHEFEGAEDAYFHDKNDFRLHDSYDFGSSWVTVGLGGQVGLSKDAYLYGDVEKSFGGDVKKKWAWNIGVRFGF